MTNEEFLEVWLGYGCAKKGLLQCEAGTIYGLVADHWIPFAGTNVNTGARFSLLPPFGTTTWLGSKNTKLPISPQLKKLLVNQCLFRCGDIWYSTMETAGYIAQQWMRGYWAMLAKLDETGTELRIPAPCGAQKVSYHGKLVTLVLPPQSSKWFGTPDKIEVNGNGYDAIVCPDASWPELHVQTLASIDFGAGHVTLTQAAFHFRIYNMESATIELGKIRAECNKHYKSTQG